MRNVAQEEDRCDSTTDSTVTIAAGLLRGGLLPQAYVYPSLMRSTRDLWRRRLQPEMIGRSPVPEETLPLNTASGV